MLKKPMDLTPPPRRIVVALPLLPASSPILWTAAGPKLVTSPAVQRPTASISCRHAAAKARRILPEAGNADLSRFNSFNKQNVRNYNPWRVQ